jgi:hypothetical protein
MKRILDFKAELPKVVQSLWVFTFILYVFFIVLHFLLPLPLINAISDNSNKMAIGIAAIVTAYFGSSYFLEEVLRKRRIDSYRKIFPYDKYGVKWDIIVRVDRTGEPHVLNRETSEIHHLWNMKTIYDLGWQFYEKKQVQIDVWNRYKRGDYIRTRGELGE